MMYALNLNIDIHNTPGSVVLETVAVSSDRSKLEEMMKDLKKELETELREQCDCEDDEDCECDDVVYMGYDVGTVFYTIDEVKVV